MDQQGSLAFQLQARFQIGREGRVELLQRAVKAGFTDTAQLKQDTDLDPLRSRADFKSLLAALEKTAEPKK